MCKVFGTAKGKIVSVYNFHRHILPALKESGPRWGGFQSYLTFSLFLIALYFAFRSPAGDAMAVGDWFAFTFLGLGGILLLYSFWLAYRYLDAGSFENTATKDDITQMGAKLEALVEVIHELVAEIRQDRNERNNKS